VSFYQARRITRPIHRLAEASKAIADGAQNQYVDFVDNNDEIRRLTTAFDYMFKTRDTHEKELE